jgi:hypothetical protein
MISLVGLIVSVGKTIVAVGGTIVSVRLNSTIVD